mgnify:CR=1 FL=1
MSEGGGQHEQAEQVCPVEGWQDAVITVVVKESEVPGRKHPGQGLSDAGAPDRATPWAGAPDPELRQCSPQLPGDSESGA